MTQVQQEVDHGTDLDPSLNGQMTLGKTLQGGQGLQMPVTRCQHENGSYGSTDTNVLAPVLEKKKQTDQIVQVEKMSTAEAK